MPQPPLLLLIGACFVLQPFSAAAAPTNDDFDNRTSLGGSSNIVASGSNTEATSEAGEPPIAGNAGGKSLWWSWTAPQNGTVTISTEGSHFDTILGAYTGNALTNLIEVASGDDSLGADPLTSIVTFHAENATVYQIAVDGYRGDFGDIATGTVVLTLDFVIDRYSLTVAANDPNRGSASVSPPPDLDGRYLAGTVVNATAQAGSGWWFAGWTGGSIETNTSVSLVLMSNLNLTANFSPIPIRTVQRSPSSIITFAADYIDFSERTFKVWNSESGTLNYSITADVDWLNVDPLTGSSRGETNSHKIHFYHPPPGNYLGTILITPLAEGAEPQSVTVALRVDSRNFGVRWQSSFGNGSVTCVRETSDGGAIAGALFPEGVGLIRLDAKGSNLWTQIFPEASLTVPGCFQQTADGGFILGGYSYPGNGGADFWLGRVDSNGNKLWSRTFGGTNDDRLVFGKQTSDHGFLLAGTSESGPSGNKVSANFGGTDFWIVRLDPNGKRLWDKSFGGSGNEFLFSGALNEAGDFVLAGYSPSAADGNKTNEDSGQWIVSFDSNGNKLREQVVPGFRPGNVLIQSLPGGGLVTAQNDGPFCGGCGVLYTVRSFGPSGAVIWETNFNPLEGTIGGLANLQATADGSILVYPFEYFNAGDHRFEAIKIDGDGEISWRRVIDPIPSTGRNGLTVLEPLSDGGLLLGGDGTTTVIRLKPLPPAPSGRIVRSSLGFRFFITGVSNQLQAIEYSTNFMDWTSFRTNLFLGDEKEIFDVDAKDPIRFYRSRVLQ